MMSPSHIQKYRAPWNLRPYFTVSDLRFPFRRLLWFAVEVFDPASTCGQLTSKPASFKIPWYGLRRKHRLLLYSNSVHRKTFVCEGVNQQRLCMLAYKESIAKLQMWFLCLFRCRYPVTSLHALILNIRGNGLFFSSWLYGICSRTFCVGTGFTVVLSPIKLGLKVSRKTNGFEFQIRTGHTDKFWEPEKTKKARNLSLEVL
jgi:hypothetical protein